MLRCGMHLAPLKRQLEDYGRRQRGDIKAHAPVPARQSSASGSRGRIMVLSRRPTGRNYTFIAKTSLNVNFDQLAAGSEVQFLEDIGSEGFQAKRVSTGKRHAGEGEEEEE